MYILKFLHLRYRLDSYRHESKLYSYLGVKPFKSETFKVKFSKVSNCSNIF